MYVLCDTCSLLMLIRLAPNMFIDARYKCCTVNEVRAEVYGNKKFKNKYPWNEDFRDRIQYLPNSTVHTADFHKHLRVVDLLVENGTIYEKTGRLFDLSRTDRIILACALCNGYRISTGDDNLRKFAMQEFTGIFKGNVSPLGLVNDWIGSGLIVWNDELQRYMTDWNETGEHPQPNTQKARFKVLTGRNYPGS